MGGGLGIRRTLNLFAIGYTYVIWGRLQMTSPPRGEGGVRQKVTLVYNPM